jgi:hypothetical protein
MVVGRSFRGRLHHGCNVLSCEILWGILARGQDAGQRSKNPGVHYLGDHVAIELSCDTHNSRIHQPVITQPIHTNDSTKL